MSNDSYMYSVFATVLGMLVVFGFLTFLSLMMVALKITFQRDSGDRGALSSAARPRLRGARRRKPVVGQEGDSGEMPEWVGAALAAYLAQEELPEWAQAALAAYLTLEEGRSAEPWSPEDQEGQRAQQAELWRRGGPSLRADRW